MKKELQNAREDYQKAKLHKSDVTDDPLRQFERWYQEYQDTGVKDANAMVLTTVSEGGVPDARVVLLKGLDKGGFEFYTNYESEKGRQIAANPEVALNFFWKELERQVRVRGSVEKMTPAESDAYFQGRPVDSQLSAWASAQSSPVKNREKLDEQLKAYQKKFGENIPRPEHWGGYRVYPRSVEFWQGRSDRLHDRLKYTKKGEAWKIERLAP